MADENKAEDAPITIKKYANRRLYNTATSSYVTLDHLSQMVKDGTDFVVYDAKSGEDITRSVLTHIIVEEESKGGQNLLPIGFLRHLISFYGDSLQSVVPNYLEHSMKAFTHNQEQMRSMMQGALEGFNPFGQLEEMGKQNAVMFENAMKMFSPFYQGEDGMPPPSATPHPSGPTPSAPGAQKPAGANENGAELDDMRQQLLDMKRQLDSLTKD